VNFIFVRNQQVKGAEGFGSGSVEKEFVSGHRFSDAGQRLSTSGFSRWLAHGPSG
jgi:hypothetical protein